MSTDWTGAWSGPANDSAQFTSGLINKGLLQNFTDDFSVDLSKWADGTFGGASIVSGHLALPYADGGGENSMGTQYVYIAQGSYALAQFADVDLTVTTTLQIYSYLGINNFVQISVVEGVLTASISSEDDGQTDTAVRAYDPTGDAWWQIAKASSDWIFYTSPTGMDGTWVPFASHPHLWAATDVFLILLTTVPF